uniref:hypothetical protein n=1 Tax=Dialister sp. TaxID=1955814 RepID=UPI0040293482
LYKNPRMKSDNDLISVSLAECGQVPQVQWIQQEQRRTFPNPPAPLRAPPSSGKREKSELRRFMYVAPHHHFSFRIQIRTVCRS